MASRAATVAELGGFLWRERMFWLMPMVLVIVVASALLIFAQVSGIAPFLYPLF